MLSRLDGFKEALRDPPTPWNPPPTKIPRGWVPERSPKGASRGDRDDTRTHRSRCRKSTWRDELQLDGRCPTGIGEN